MSPCGPKPTSSYVGFNVSFEDKSGRVSTGRLSEWNHVAVRGAYRHPDPTALAGMMALIGYVNELVRAKEQVLVEENVAELFSVLDAQAKALSIA